MMMRKRYVWLVTIVWLFILNMLKRSIWEEWISTMLSNEEIYDAMIILSWLLLRLTSFSIEYCNEKVKSIERAKKIRDNFSTIHLLAYSFYLPVFLHGPPLIYKRYETMFHVQTKTNKNQQDQEEIEVEESWQRIKQLLITLFRIGIIYLVNEFCMHYIYSNVVIYNPDVSRTSVNFNTFFNSM